MARFSLCDAACGRPNQHARSVYTARGRHPDNLSFVLGDVALTFGCPAHDLLGHQLIPLLTTQRFPLDHCFFL